MILKLLAFVTTTVIIRCESLWTESTSKPSVPRDLQELLDSLYMTGYIPEYILPEDDLTETEKTEGEYLDFPELKNAQDDVFVPPESEYSKNSLHYKNIKPRKRLIPEKYRKIKISGLQREILQPGISPEELRSDLLVHLVENITGKEQKSNNSVKLDFLFPIPEKGVYPSINSPTQHHNLTECFSTTERRWLNNGAHCSTRTNQRGSPRPTEHFRSRPTESNKLGPTDLCNTETTKSGDLRPTEICSPEPIAPGTLRPTEICSPEPIEYSNSSTTENCSPEPIRSGNSSPTENCNTEKTENGNLGTTELCNTEPNGYGNTKTTEIYNTEQTENCNPGTTTTGIGDFNTTKPGNAKTSELCDIRPTEPMDKKKINPHWPMNIPSIQVLFEIPSPQGSTNLPNTQGSMKVLSTRWPIPNQQMLMKVTSSRASINTPNLRGSMKFPKPQGPMNITNPSGSIKMPSPQGTMNMSNSPQGSMKILNPQGNMNIPNPSQWFINMSDQRGPINRNNKEYTTLKQYLFTIPEYTNMPKHTEFKPNITIPQPITFEIISPESERNTKTFKFTAAMQSQHNVTIKPAFEQQIKSMLNIQLWPKQLLPQFILNTKQPENGLRSSGLNIQTGKQTASISLMPRINRTIHALEQQMITSGIDNSSKRVDIKMVDKNIATNVVSLRADPSSNNKIEAEGGKAVVKPSISLDGEITQNVETSDRQSHNLSESIKPSSQNTKFKERKYVNQSYKSNSSGKENADNGKPKKKMFTFLNIFKKNKKYPPPDAPSQNISAQMKREIIENSSDQLYRQLLETNVMTDIDDVESQYPIRQELEEEETFNHKRKKK